MNIDVYMQCFLIPYAPQDVVETVLQDMYICIHTHTHTHTDIRVYAMFSDILHATGCRRGSAAGYKHTYTYIYSHTRIYIYVHAMLSDTLHSTGCR